MAINGSILGQQILGQFASKGFTGSQSANFANAVGNGIVTNILATNIYQGTTTGSMGAGVGTGKASGLIGPLVGLKIYDAMIGKGWSGSQQLNMAMAVGEAFANHILAFGIVNSSPSPTLPPVAVGVGVGTITGIVGATMGQSILSFFSSAGMTGSQIENTSKAIGSGIAESMSAVIVNTVIVGVISPPPTPTVGAEIGKLT